MQRKYRGLTLVVFSLVASMILVGCGGGSDNTPATVTGKWGFVDPNGNAETLDLQEADNVISGTTAQGGTVSGGGTRRSRNIKIVYPTNYTIDLSLVLDGCTMSGTVTDSNGGTGTIVLTLENCGDGGDISAGVYSGTENVCISMPGMPQTCIDAPVQFYVDDNGQLLIGSDVEVNTGSGRATLSSSQTGNMFTLSTTATVPGAGSMTVTYNGTITEQAITGTISGSGNIAGMNITVSGTFTATRGGNVEIGIPIN